MLFVIVLLIAAALTWGNEWSVTFSFLAFMVALFNWIAGWNREDEDARLR